MRSLPHRPAGRADAPSAAPEGFFRAHRTGLVTLAVLAAAAALGWEAWRRYGELTRGARDGVVLPANVELRGAAPWVPKDLKTQALRDASLDGGLPLDDPELTRRLARAFAMQPWVKEVVRVEPRHPAAVVVEIRCRAPAAMVAVPGGLLAVDADGVLLPSDDFTRESAADYPRVSGVTSSPQGAAGSEWGDPVVAEAAALAAVIGPEWKQFGLVDCRPASGTGGNRAWELVDGAGRVIRFGAAPGSERPGEPTPAVKVARLRSLSAADRDAAVIDLTLQPAAEAGPPPAIPAG